VLNRGITSYNEDRRRKYEHWLVTLTYSDGETFGRVYIDRKKANKFAERQKKSPLVKKARIRRLSWFELRCRQHISARTVCISGCLDFAFVQGRLAAHKSNTLPGGGWRLTVGAVEAAVLAFIGGEKPWQKKRTARRGIPAGWGGAELLDPTGLRHDTFQTDAVLIPPVGAEW
jgi:hypothetical protein